MKKPINRLVRYFFIVTLSVVVATPGALAQGKENKRKNKKEKDKPAAVAVSNQERAKLERLLIEAERAKVIEDWDEAIKNYNDILAIDPYNANAHFQLSQVYTQQNKLAEAEKELLLAVKADGTNKWFLESLAGLYLNTGKTKEAIETYKTLNEKFPANPDYLLNLGFLYSRQGQFENAIKTYDQFEKNFGLDEQVIEEKKNLYLRNGKFNEAVNEVRKLQDAYPGETQFLLQEAELYRANRMKEKAIEVYKKILEVEPDNPQAQLGMTSLSMTSTDGGQSIENLRGIFENNKVGIDTKVSILLISYIQMNSDKADKRKEALELADILVRVHPDEAKAHAIKADILYLDEQNEKALEEYKKALALNKDVYQVWQQLIAIYNLQRDWENVLKAANEAMELFPNQNMLYLFKGTAEMQLKQYDKALKSFSKGEKMSIENEKLRAQFFANMGDIYHSLNKPVESDSAYEKSLKLDPNNAYVLNNYSYYLSLRKVNLERAKQMSAFANQLEPDNSSFLDTYAWILFQMNDYKGAREWQEKALKAGGDKSGTILEHYGDILYKLGNKSEAVGYWKKAKELGTDSGTIDKKIADEKYIE